MPEVLRAITFAGSDSSGCAGLQADLRTFQKLGVHGLSVLTAVTAQTAHEVLAVEPVSLEVIEAQFRAAEQVGFSAGKSGLLGGADIIGRVAELWSGHADIPLVVDPVLGSSSGRTFLDDVARRSLRRRLLPVAAVVTPNLPEAEWLVERPLANEGEILEAAREIQTWGVPTVVIKGGHGESGGDRVRDLVLAETGSQWLSGTRLPAPNSRGTGCIFSAAIAAFLAAGLDSLEAIRRAHAVVRQGLRAGYSLGNQPGPACGLTGHLRRNSD